MSEWDAKEKAKRDYAADMIRLIGGFTADIICMDEDNLSESDLQTMEKWLNYYRSARNKLCEHLSEDEVLDYSREHQTAYEVMGELEECIRLARMKLARGEKTGFNDLGRDKDEDAQ